MALEAREVGLAFSPVGRAVDTADLAVGESEGKPHATAPLNNAETAVLRAAVELGGPSRRDDARGNRLRARAAIGHVSRGDALQHGSLLPAACDRVSLHLDHDAVAFDLTCRPFRAGHVVLFGRQRAS